ncbi:hypothetical protein MRX96_010831 [Rhipicephalus microplus]
MAHRKKVACSCGRLRCMVSGERNQGGAVDAHPGRHRTSVHTTLLCSTGAEGSERRGAGGQRPACETTEKTKGRPKKTVDRRVAWNERGLPPHNLPDDKVAPGGGPGDAGNARCTCISSTNLEFHGLWVTAPIPSPSHPPFQAGTHASRSAEHPLPTDLPSSTTPNRTLMSVVSLLSLTLSGDAAFGRKCVRSALRHPADVPWVRTQVTAVEKLGPPATSSPCQWRGSGSRGETDCLLCCLNYCLGLSNVVSFPYLIYNNGGVVFIVVYLVLLCVVAVPMLYLEIFLGQFCGWSVPGVYAGFPMAKGLGWTMILIVAFTMVFYVSPVAYCVIYLTAMFQAELPWNSCGGGDHGADERDCYHVKPGTYACSKVNETLARRYRSHNYSGESVIVVSGSVVQEPVSVPVREYEALRNNCVSGTVSAAEAFYT